MSVAGAVASVGSPDRAWSVSALTAMVKELLEQEPELTDFWVHGEVSNFKRHTSGHCYFTLKDAGATLRCVMFRGQAASLPFRPSDGMAVRVRGRIGVFARDGTYQCYAQCMEPAGLGSLHLAFEQLKARLAAEGLFAEACKRPLPRFPKRVALVTSPTGAALRDMVHVATRRCPTVELVLVPALVQGADAPASLVQAIGLAAACGADVVIVGRGGGSLEELWAFNDEAVARAIRECPVPVVSAVGHETDFTIADFVADRRAPTPSAAAEVVVPERTALRAELEACLMKALGAVRARVQRERIRLYGATRGVLERPDAALRPQHLRLQHAAQQLAQMGIRVSERRMGQFQALAGRLEAMSPMGVLARGFAVCRDTQGRVLTRVMDTSVGARVEVLLAEGALQARVEAQLPGIGVWKQGGGPPSNGKRS